jgi:hypothetical protein
VGGALTSPASNDGPLVMMAEMGMGLLDFVGHAGIMARRRSAEVMHIGEKKRPLLSRA